MAELEIPIEKRILVIRGHRVLIDVDLAELYGVTRKRLREQLRRNQNRFPPEFAFQLTLEEREIAAAKCGTLNKIRFSPILPYAFTEHRVVMAANVLNSEKAIEMSIFIVRSFIKLKEAMLVNKQLAEKFIELESKVEVHDEASISIECY